MKKLLTILIGFAFLAASTASVRAADVSDEQKQAPRPPVENVGGYSGAYYDDQRTLFRAFTYVESWASASFVENGATTCTSALSAPCDKTDNLFFETPLSPCSSDRVKDCVLGVSGKSQTGDWLPAQLIETTTPTFADMGTEQRKRYFTPFTGDPKRGVPDSGFISIWKIPGLGHAGGSDEYLLIPKLNIEHQNQGGDQPANLDVGVFPITKISSAGKRSSDCFILTEDYCLIRWAHPEDSSFRISLKLGSKILGWFHGRIYEPTIESTRTSDGQNLITVEGKVMRVPILAAWAKNTELPRILDQMIEQEFQDRGQQFAGVAFFGGNEKDRSLQTVMDERNPSFNDSYFARYLEWVKVAQDKAYSNPSTWSFRTMDKAANFWRCIDNGTVVGMVTTNSNAYIAGPPVFADGVLSYKVSSPHYDSQGNVQVGTYDLAIRSDVARCIYGFTSAPIQASVSIVYDDGQSKSATTVVSEKNNWLRLSAKGFTYSSPTLKVSLSQEASSEAKTSQAAATVKRKSTITCVKGKVNKKITGANPKCPTGYKKK